MRRGLPLHGGALRFEGGFQIDPRALVARIRRDGAAQRRDRFIQPAVPRQRNAEIVQRRQMIGLDPQRRAIPLDPGMELAGADEEVAPGIEHSGVLRPQPQRLLVVGGRLRRPPLGGERFAPKVMGLRVLRVGRRRLSKLRNRLLRLARRLEQQPEIVVRQ
jgi:hypothetical protein